jgi:hypothetical protein
MKMRGITARSESLSAVNCDASLVKIRHGVNSCVFRLARTGEWAHSQRVLAKPVYNSASFKLETARRDVHFWFSASNRPIRATM